MQHDAPGYRRVNGPVFDGNRISVYLEVEGLGGASVTTAFPPIRTRPAWMPSSR